MLHHTLSAVVTLLVSFSAIAAPAPAPATSYGKLPMSFEENRGQMDSRVKFLTRNGGAILSLKPAKVVVTLPEPAPIPDAETPRAARHQPPERSRLRHTVALKLAGANRDAVMEGVNPLIGKVNYLLGRDRAGWKIGIPTYAAVRSREVYPGIDVVYYGNEQQFEYDFVVAPGAHPDAIRLTVEGAQRVSIDQAGDLILQVGDRVVRQKKPLAYQELNGIRRVVAARYVKRGREIRFRVGDYDRRSPLVIDPVLELLYSTYFGGLDGGGTAIAVDGSGSAYITTTHNLPGLATPGAYQASLGGVAVTKFSPDGSQRLYTTYLNGTGTSIALDTAGNAYVAGLTSDPDLGGPIANGYQPNGYQTLLSPGPYDAFVAKLNADGTDLLYSTYIGGDFFDVANAIAVIGETAYVTGWTSSSDFPVTANAFQLIPENDDIFEEDAFVAKFDTSQSGPPSGLFVTLVGGTGSERGFGIDADANGKVYITGSTYPGGTFMLGGWTVTPCSDANADAFVVRIDTVDPPSVEMSTCLKTGNPLGEFAGYGIAAGPGGSIYVTGDTRQPLIIDPNYTGLDAFVTRLNADGSVVYSSYLSGANSDFGKGIAVDVNGSAYITGLTDSLDFPIKDAFQPSYGGGSGEEHLHDAFVTKLDPAGFIVYSSYFGGDSDDQATGIAVDLAQNVYFTGQTESTGLATPGAFQTDLGGAFVVKLAEINTFAGFQIVKPVDTMTGNSPVTITFTNVTEAGVTSLTTSASGPNPPSGFQLGTPPTYYELSTTATWGGIAEVCIDYTNISFVGNEADLKLFHYVNNVPVDVTTPGFPNTVTNIICGLVFSFSPFAIFEPIAITDASGPVIVPTVSPAPNGAGWNNGPVTVSWDVSDPESGIASSSGCATQTLSSDTPGTTITCSAENGAGLTSSVSVDVKIDTIAPVLSCAATPNTLSPANHKLVAVIATVSVMETGSGAGAATLTSVTSNEPDNGSGDGDTANDVQGFVVGTADFTGLLRAERSGSGNGRVYTLSYAATDIAGNTGVCTTTVSVPHNKGK